LEPFSKEECREIVKSVEAFGSSCIEKYGSRIFYPSDELYLKGGLEIPTGDFYEGYPQIENGVGMIASM
jgi:NifB/MoaA-like Fe-S oxidoreductase